MRPKRKQVLSAAVEELERIRNQAKEQLGHDGMDDPVRCQYFKNGSWFWYKFRESALKEEIKNILKIRDKTENRIRQSFPSDTHVRQCLALKRAKR